MSRPGGARADAPSVMAYPGKVEKAKRAEQSVAACVLEVRTGQNGAEPQLLLVQRPETGLLAGNHDVLKQVCVFIEMPVRAADAARGGGDMEERLLAVNEILFWPIWLPSGQERVHRTARAAHCCHRPARTGMYCKGLLEDVALHKVHVTLSLHVQKMRTQHPERYQCAGLWEFPGVTVSAEASETDRKNRR